MRFLLFALLLSTISYGQTNTYEISFDNAVHHEAQINITFPSIKNRSAIVRMSRTSPGRYALHEFAKNVYDFKATDSKGKALSVTRPDPYSWEISGHDGTINVQYLLFANRGDGTYSQIDETHAHLNIPATFMYMETTEERPIEITFNTRKDLNWKVATQLKSMSDTKFYAPNLYYFMDSPTDISDYKLRETTIDGQKIRFVLNSPDTDADLDTYWENVKAIVMQEKAVFGELPTFDYGTYTFLASYFPNVSGDGMEHRNSTILTDKETLANGGMDGNIGTVAHEFFHAWNVERIRPADLEPFNFTEANMSEGLWFAEGFTSYYTNLMLARAAIITKESYVQRLNRTFNYVWNSPALKYFNPIEMSYQAPFVDAATSVDPVNRGNTFVSYYSYGSMLGLALDLSLREKGLNLDDYFKMVWQQMGKNEVSYKIEDLERLLGEYAGDAFAKAYFSSYIYNSNMPNYDKLLQSVGLSLQRDTAKAYTGTSLKASEGGLTITQTLNQNTPAYNAGLEKDDLITAINGTLITTIEDYDNFLAAKKPGEKIDIQYERFGTTKTTSISLTSDPTYMISINPKASKKAEKVRKNWLDRK